MVAFALVVALIALFVISVKLVMPTVGQELMPPMDTGAIAIKITTDANLPIEQTQEVMETNSYESQAQSEAKQEL